MDRLYGVTMPEKGISQLVSVDLQKAESLVALMTEDLKTRLKIAKSNFKKKNPSSNNDKKTSFGKAFQLSTELVSAVLVATIIGFILDNWFDTKPWLIIYFFIGVATGIINVIRSAKKCRKTR